MAQPPAPVSSRTLVACAFMLAMGLTACGKPPDTELAQAQAAVAAAQRQEHYAPDDFRKASDALKAAQDEIAAQKGKPFASYGRARELLAGAMKSVADAKRAADTRARALAEELLPKAEKALAEARQRLKRGEKGSLTAAYGTPEFDQQVFAVLHRANQSKEGMDITFNDLGKLIEDAKHALAEGDAESAANKAGAVLEDLERFYPGISGSKQ